MVLGINQVTFPPDQSSKVAQRYIEWLKKSPPDPTIEKTICIGVRNTEDGNILVIGISDIVKGKVEEALKLTIQGNLFMAAGIEGFKYKTDVMLNYTEAYKILGMTAPAEV
ncbi:MAG: hypothetical protein ACFE8A_07985 [Candidatus Hodarchaeota archaeon]